MTGRGPGEEHERRPVRRGAALLAVTLAAWGATLAGCAAQQPGGAGASEASEAARASASTEPPRDGTGFTPEPEPPPVTPDQPAPVSDPDAVPPAAGAPCQPSQLIAVSTPVDAATGYRQMDVVVTNTSDLACVLDGFPGVDGTGLAGSDLTLARVEGVWSDPADGEARTLEVAPGAAARVHVGWRGDPVGPYDERVGAFQLVLDGTADGPGVGVALDPAAYPLDIIDGHEVRTSGWLPVR
ncbi:DUF4232 domain-containing protein [Nocardioides zeae]|uniref:DUF4232 domain-containing protein n=1 Tax=Nocardioides zeae TaxID=1457234 RepID=A0A6P0HPU8_9ACTN|nr:DUF4232 domain-containing protein [Nocardioides zeae]